MLKCSTAHGDPQRKEFQEHEGTHRKVKARCLVWSKDALGTEPSGGWWRHSATHRVNGETKGDTKYLEPSIVGT